MFPLHSANHTGHLSDVTEAGGPVGDGEAGVVAGDEGTGNDEDEGRERGKNRKIMMRPVEGRGQRSFQVRVSLCPHITTGCDAQPTMVSLAVGGCGKGNGATTSDSRTEMGGGDASATWL